MSRHTHVIVDYGKRRITPAEQSVLWACADEIGRYGDYAELSLTDLCQRTKFSKPALLRAIKTLERDKVLDVDRPLHGSRSHHNRYRINEDRLTADEKAPTGQLALPVEPDNRSTSVTTTGNVALPLSFIPKDRAKPFAPEPSGSSVEVSTSVRPYKQNGRTAKARKKARAEEAALRAILGSAGVEPDPYLPRAILAVSYAEDNSITLATVENTLERFIAAKSWNGAGNQSAIIVEAMKALIHTAKLKRAEDQALIGKVCTCGRRGRCEYCLQRAKVN